MRTIKFMGLRVDGKGWAYGYYVKGSSRHCILPDLGGIQHDVHPETVGQFTGLHDKNGKEIYEGDKDQNGYVIMWSEKHALFCQHYLQPYYNKWSEASYPMDVSRVEIIGNIHENPELLTK